MSRLMQKPSCLFCDTQDEAERIQDQDFLSGVNPQDVRIDAKADSRALKTRPSVTCRIRVKISNIKDQDKRSPGGPTHNFLCQDQETRIKKQNEKSPGRLNPNFRTFYVTQV